MYHQINDKINSIYFYYIIVFKSTKNSENISPLQFKSQYDVIENNSMHMLDRI